MCEETETSLERYNSMDMNVHYTSDNQFSNYSDASVTIKANEYKSNIIVTNDSVLPFTPIDIKLVTLDDLTDIFAFAPDLIIFGSGDKVVYPDLKLFYALNQKGIGVEVMPIQALCRTFNFLVGEDRKVAGVLMFPA
jgi:uncharacterized protein